MHRLIILQYTKKKTTNKQISVISWRSVLLVEETGVPGENHRPVASHRQSFITYCCIEYTLSWAGFELTTLVWLIFFLETSGLNKYHDQYNPLERLG